MTARSLYAGAALAAFLAAAPSRATVPIPAEPAPATGHWHDVSLDEYRQHLQDLTTLVEACAKARDSKTCDPALVGPDDRVPLIADANAERRPVRYGWLRVLLAKAQEKDKDSAKPEPKAAAGANGAPSEESALPVPPTTTELLLSAEARLAQDLAQINAATPAAPAHAQERKAMKQVLAERDFRHLEEPSARDTLLEKLGNWLNKLFESAAQLRVRSAWVGLVLYWGFILAVCVGLAWGLMQLERRWRIRLVPESSGPAAGAASARDWQLWPRGRAPRRRRRPVARGDPFCLLGGHFAPRIQAAVAGRPRPHSARVPGAGGRGGPAPARDWPR